LEATQPQTVRDNEYRGERHCDPGNHPALVTAVKIAAARSHRHDYEVVDVIASTQGLEELSAVVARDKFRRWFSLEKAQSFVTRLAHRGQLLPDIANPIEATRDRDDDYLVALANAHQARLVSVDSDLLDANLESPAISPRELLGMLGIR